MINLNIGIDENLKAEAEAVLSNLGLSTSEAVRLFFAQVRNTRSIPFPLKAAEEPNEELIQAMKETMERKNLMSFGSTSEFLEWLDK